MRVLVACEESQVVTKAFRAKGHEAYSCDLIDCSGGHPEWHIKGDVLQHLNNGWDMMIAFPPCTHICVSGAAWFEKKKRDGRQQQGIDFFMDLVFAPMSRIAIENPIGIMSTEYKKPTQIIHPFYFGDPISKATCLWLEHLPPLESFETDTLFNKKTWISPEIYTTPSGVKYDKWWYNTGLITIKNDKRAKERSKTFHGIANAMAEQWG